MCGRYYIDEETYSEIQMVVSDVEQSLKHGRKTEDICPTDTAPVIVSDNDQKLVLTDKIWGYPGWKNKGVILMPDRNQLWEKECSRMVLDITEQLFRQQDFMNGTDKKKRTHFSEKIPVCFIWLAFLTVIMMENTL